MAAATKTVELPLTKSERRHQDNISRRDEKRRRTTEKQTSKAERDAAIKTINDNFGPKISKLEIARKAALAKVWKDWRTARSESV